MGLRCANSLLFFQIMSARCAGVIVSLLFLLQAGQMLPSEQSSASASSRLHQLPMFEAEFLWKQLRSESEPTSSNSLSDNPQLSSGIARRDATMTQSAATALSSSSSSSKISNKNKQALSSQAQCVFNCVKTMSTPVCASDGHVYPSRCFVKFLRHCHREKLNIVRDRPCKPNASAFQRGACPPQRDAAVRQLSDGQQVPFLPVCQSNGSFRTVQCNHSMRYCFCVNATSGQPRTGTGVSMPQIPQCELSNQKLAKKKKKKNRRQKSNRCEKGMRIQFITNFIAQFVVEYQRETAQRLIRGGVNRAVENNVGARNQVQWKRAVSGNGGFAALPLQGTESFPLNTTEKRATEWKFSELDRNLDNRLSFRETRVLRRMARKFIKPTVCARHMFRQCDHNNNRHLERSEWQACLGIGNKATKIVNSVSTTILAPLKTKMPIQEEDSSLLTLIAKPRRNKNNAFPKQKCENLRLEALKKNAVITQATKVFVPHCTSDGHYAKRQCYSITNDEQLCFCMDPNTGSVAKGSRSSSSSREINCDNVKSERTFKGCPLIKQKQFFANLIDLVAAETKSQWSSSGGPLLSATVSPEERALHWKFYLLDTDRNQILDGSELRIWRRQIKSNWILKISSDLRKCARNFLRFCDLDDNKALTFGELHKCTKLEKVKKRPPIVARQ